jgi:transposase
MPGPYSDDLRAKVMAALQRGEKKSHVSAMFHISRDTLDRWLKRQAATGSAKAAQGYQRGHSHRIKDWAAFRAFAVQYGDKTQAEMAQHWPGAMSQRTLARALARIGWTRKKRRMATANEMQPNAPLSKRN